MKPIKMKNKDDVSDEVEELLRAAQDDVLLKLSINSHTVHPSPSDLHPDLEQRYRDLKSGSKSKPKTDAKAKSKPPPESDKVMRDVEGDDLFTRFAALKASLPKPSSSSSSFLGVSASDTSLENAAGGSLVGKGGVDEEEDEVEKILRWAKDAARLDPSPPSDDDEDLKDDDYDDIETSDEDSDSSRKN